MDIQQATKGRLWPCRIRSLCGRCIEVFFFFPAEANSRAWHVPPVVNCGPPGSAARPHMGSDCIPSSLYRSEGRPSAPSNAKRVR